MTRYRTRLLFGLITLIFIVLIGLGVLLGQLFKGHYINTYDSRLSKESRIISAFIEDSGGINHLDNEKINWFSETLDGRITIVNRDEKIIYDSGHLDNITGEQHESFIRETLNEPLNDINEVKMMEVNSGNNLHYFWTPIVNKGEMEGYLFLSTKLTEIQKAYQQIWWLLIISLGTALIIIVLLGSSLMVRYTKPIESATKVAIELANGNYRARTYENHLGEVGLLSSSINILARNLQGMVKANEIQQGRMSALIESMGSGLLLIDSTGHIILLNRTYKELFHVRSEDYIELLYYDVIEHKEISNLIEEIVMTEQKIRKQLHLSIGIERRYFDVYGVPVLGMREEWKGILLVFHDITEMKKLEQVRKDFVANVSHELKTPVTSIKGFTETLLDGAKADPEALERFLQIILKESNRLESLIVDLLELSKIEQQGYTLQIQKVHLRSLLQDMIQILTNRAEEKNIELILDGNEEEIVIEGDDQRLKQIFLNLISNAIAYTLDGGKVIISIRETQNVVLVSVKDTGIGITKEEIPRIFERFYRVDRARSRNSGGTGLGLAIVKHLVEAHKGKIVVESGVGIGTTFTIELQKNFLKK